MEGQTNPVPKAAERVQHDPSAGAWQRIEEEFSASGLGGLLLLPAGWIIVLAAVALLPSAPPRAAFVLAGIGVEMLGLAILIRSHRIPRGPK